MNGPSLQEQLSRLGTMILLTSEPALDEERCLGLYRRRDGVEKFFDALKNGLDGKRPRVHGEQTLEGRLLVEFLALIVHSILLGRMRAAHLLTECSVQELLLELRKIKLIRLGERQPILSEVSKRQCDLFEKLQVPPPQPTW